MMLIESILRGFVDSCFLLNLVDARKRQNFHGTFWGGGGFRIGLLTFLARATFRHWQSLLRITRLDPSGVVAPSAIRLILAFAKRRHPL